MGGVRAKIGLTGQLDRRQPGNYFKPWLAKKLLVNEKTTKLRDKQNMYPERYI